MVSSIMHSLAGLAAFGGYFAVSVVALLVFKYIYVLITPHNEWKLIKEDKNTAAAVALGGAMVGFSIALAGAASNSLSLIDFIVWAVVATVAQILGYAIVRGLLMPKISSRLENGEVSAGVIVAALSISIGLLNAACMTY
jgi:putative membrane protein